ncbi:hypothetical protein [Methylobacterium sp. ID0610]|uniref:hypothetical protein n=1 Tax=Methylobacterium carpenticola TaxID=3344827 RepID=UPI0036813017
MSRSFIGICVALLTGAGVTVSHAESTPEQRAACTPDVFRLCSSEIPDETRIKACLRRERPNLSRGCQAVFNALDRAPRAASASVRS